MTNLHIQILYIGKTDSLPVHSANMSKSKKELSQMVLVGTKRWIEKMEASLSSHGHIPQYLLRKREGQLRILCSVLDMQVSEDAPTQTTSIQQQRQDVKSTIICVICKGKLQMSKLSTKHQLVKCNDCNTEVHKKCLKLGQSCLCPNSVME